MSTTWEDIGFDDHLWRDEVKKPIKVKKTAAKKKAPAKKTAAKKKALAKKPAAKKKAE